jgi:hypothetical protein
MTEQRKNAKQSLADDEPEDEGAETAVADGDGDGAERAEDDEPAEQEPVAAKPKAARRKASARREPPPAEPTASRRTVMLALFSGLAVGAAGGFGGGYYYATRRRRRERPPEGPAARAYVELAPWSPRKGPNPAKVTIVEFSDFQ